MHARDASLARQARGRNTQPNAPTVAGGGLCASTHTRRGLMAVQQENWGRGGGEGGFGFRKSLVTLVERWPHLERKPSESLVFFLFALLAVGGFPGAHFAPNGGPWAPPQRRGRRDGLAGGSGECATPDAWASRSLPAPPHPLPDPPPHTNHSSQARFRATAPTTTPAATVTQVGPPRAPPPSSLGGHLAAPATAESVASMGPQGLVGNVVERAAGGGGTRPVPIAGTPFPRAQHRRESKVREERRKVCVWEVAVRPTELSSR